LVQPGLEDCDDGNDNNNDSCLNTCQAASCGDGYLFLQDEACDDGNADNGDGCSATCTVEPAYRCSISTPSICANIGTFIEWNGGDPPPSLGNNIWGQKVTIFIRSAGNLGWDFDLSTSSVLELVIVADDGLVMGAADSAQPLITFAGGSGGRLHLVNMSVQNGGHGVLSGSGDVSLTRVRMDTVSDTALAIASGVAKLDQVELVNVQNGVSVTSGALELTDVQMNNISGTAL
jgi:cysteine-rich repeat protein